MMKKARKLFALCLALVMCVGLFTVAASAEGEEAKPLTEDVLGESLYTGWDARFDGYERFMLPGGYYYLEDDMELHTFINTDEHVFIDLRGHVLKGSSMLSAGGNANLTLYDSTDEPGTLEANILVAYSSEVKVDGVSATGMLITDGGMINIISGDIIGQIETIHLAFGPGVTISGGTIHKDIQGSRNSTYYRISGGTFGFDPRTLASSWNEPIVEGYIVVKNLVPIDGCDETWTVVKGIKDDPNGGHWADGNTDVKEYDLVDGEEFSHDELTRDGYTLTGWDMREDEGVYTFTAQWEKNGPDTLTLTADSDTIYTNSDPSTAVLTLTYEPEDAELGEIEWTQEGAGEVEFVTASENSAGSGSGADGAGETITKTVKALSPGEVTITATDPVSGKTASVTMKVVAVMPQTEPEEPTEPTEPT